MSILKKQERGEYKAAFVISVNASTSMVYYYPNALFFLGNHGHACSITDYTTLILFSAALKEIWKENKKKCYRRAIGNCWENQIAQIESFDNKIDT